MSGSGVLTGHTDILRQNSRQRRSGVRTDVSVRCDVARGRCPAEPQPWHCGQDHGADGAGGNPATNLYVLDPTNGAIVSTIGPFGFAITGLAFDPSTGVLYGSTGNQSPTSPKSLVRIDTSTGAGTLIGSFGVSGQTMADLTFGGTLYGSGSSRGDLYTVDRATGLATFVGASGRTAFDRRQSSSAMPSSLEPWSLRRLRDVGRLRRW